MIDISNMDIVDLVNYINSELKKDIGISVNRLCDKLDIKKSTLKNKLSRSGYSYNIEKKQYEECNTTSNTTEILQTDSAKTEENLNKIILLNEFDVDKLNLLLNNIDELLTLVGKKNITCNITVDNDKTSVKSLRINDEIYNKIKDVSAKNKISISSIVNKALLDYLNNYL